MKPLPKVNGDNEEFWKGCREHRLMFQKCADCGHIRWPAAALCPECLSMDTEWIEAGGRGTIYTFAVYHVAYLAAFEEDLPYVVATVELTEGPHLLTNVVGCGPDQVTCGMPVEVAWKDVTAEFSLPKFRPVLKREYGIRKFRI
ncbi:MAG: Zn-ribbon domain-containing OB-fold protein [Deltaproteobacteria bacterium]|nr:Zn-ribbon domain-containing OB-fold protein [Deltaproteobacteria bacterium]MBW2282998.1 Zn-ribbon domain-containing OB-fold protein [Deltaproteobacteria bacterium]